MSSLFVTTRRFRPDFSRIRISLRFPTATIIENVKEIPIFPESGRNRRLVTNSELIQAGKTFFSGPDDV